MWPESIVAVDCPFCGIIHRGDPAEVLRVWPDAIAISPRRPLVPGHALVIPLTHVADALSDSEVTAMTFRRAGQMAAANLATYRHVNMITSVGVPATQTVFHLHVHLVPRHQDDGLLLPWSNQ